MFVWIKFLKGILDFFFCLCYFVLVSDVGSFIIYIYWTSINLLSWAHFDIRGDSNLLTNSKYIFFIKKLCEKIGVDMTLHATQLTKPVSNFAKHDPFWP